jgi:glycosyltransferase involved in cell wall biosynthesis
LKIVFFTCFAQAQGTYFRWHNFAIGLRQLGHDVSVLMVESKQDAPHWEDRDGVPYHIVPMAPGTRVIGAHAHPWTVLRRALREVGPADIFHAFQPFAITCLPALLRQIKCRHLVWDWDDLWHGGIIQPTPNLSAAARYTNWTIRSLEQHMPRWADSVTTCSHYLADLATQRGAKRTQIIHNGFWPENQRTSRAEARAKFQLQPNARYYGFMGRTVQEIDWCFDVLRLSAPTSNVRLALCGMSPETLAAMPADLIQRTDYLGKLTPQDAKVFANAIDCGLLPLEDNAFNKSRFPIKFSEYLAGGATMLCSEIGEIAHFGRAHAAVTLAGVSRDDWRSTVATHLAAPTTAAQEPPAALMWENIASQLAAFYDSCLVGRAGASTS